MSPVQPSDDDESEFVALLTGHQRELRMYVLSLMPGRHEAADVAQLANATIWKKRSDFNPGSNFKAWIFAIARFEVLNFRKRESRDSRLVFSDELEELFAQELPMQSEDLDARQSALTSCLENLKPPHRQLVQHFYFHRTPLKQYADKTGRSADGLKVTLHRIRNSLAACIEGKMSAIR